MEKFLRRVIQNFQYILDQIGQFFRVLVTPVEIEKPKNKEKRSPSSNKMERFSPNARQVLVKAQEAAEILGHEKIDLEHLLLAMGRVQDCAAYRILADLQIGESELVNQVKRVFPTGHPFKNPDLSEDVRKSLELSVDAARQVGHHYIDSEHLLIGIMRVDKPEMNSILAHFSTDAKTVIEHTEAVLNQRNNSKKDER
jgi:ATP-dependent Clp protease ATP-binding subunit ClpC